MDGLDVGVFDFWVNGDSFNYPAATAPRSDDDVENGNGDGGKGGGSFLLPRDSFKGTRAPVVTYKTIANKTFDYDNERRDFILKLR